MFEYFYIHILTDGSALENHHIFVDHFGFVNVFFPQRSCQVSIYMQKYDIWPYMHVCVYTVRFKSSKILSVFKHLKSFLLINAALI